MNLSRAIQKYPTNMNNQQNSKHIKFKISSLWTASNRAGAKYITPALSLAVLLLPTVVFGASLIPCGQPDGTPPIMVGGASYTTTNPCGFNDLIVLANVIVHFLMYDIAVPLAALGFMWAGASLILYQDKEGEWKKAKERFESIAIGFIIMIASYVVIKTIIFSVLRPDSGYTLFLLN